MSAAPTAAYLQVRRVRPAPWYGHIRAAEALFSQFCGAVGHEVVPRLGVAGERRRYRRLRRRAGLTSSDLVPPLTGPPADLGIVWASDLADAGELLDARPDWDAFARTRAIVLFECWPGDLERHGAEMLDLLRSFDAVVFALESDALAPVADASTRVLHLPQGAVTSASCPVPGHRRPVAVVNYGRRDESQHEQLLAWSRRTGRWYHYDTARIGPTPDPIEHHRVLGRLLAETDVSICNRARFTETDRTKGTHEVGSRFYEAIAAGCAIAGRLPRTAVFVEHFGDAPGVIDLESGDADVAGAIERLLADADHLEVIHRRHRALALREHDVAHRLASLLTMLAVEPPSALQEHRRALIAEADRLTA